MKKMGDPKRFTRRGFLQSASVAGLATSGLAIGLRAKPSDLKAGRAKARNLIFLVADGMCHGTLACAQHWSKLTTDRDCEWMQLYRDGLARRALMETRSQSSLVTDSAAASSSWGGGERVPNGRINVNANGEVVTPLYTFGKQAGKQLGLVTTATITHATPAGFAANQLSRNRQDAIAVQYLERERRYPARRRPDSRVAPQRVRMGATWPVSLPRPVTLFSTTVMSLCTPPARGASSALLPKATFPTHWIGPTTRLSPGRRHRLKC
jgi:alkaline phosphatase